MKPLILASASPRRAQLLTQAGFSFTVDPSQIKEDLTLDLPPAKLAEFLPQKKAEEVAERHQNALIIAADTLVVIDGKPLGKPHTADEALAMLTKLNGRTHEVITAFTILDTTTHHIHTESVTTQVTFKENSRAALEFYARTSEPLGKAGAYAIQGDGGDLIEAIEGDYHNVVGLPIKEVHKALTLRTL